MVICKLIILPIVNYDNLRWTWIFIINSFAFVAHEAHKRERKMIQLVC